MQMDIQNFKPSKGFIYVIISFALWLIAEYLTVWNSRFEEWMSLMPFAAIQYLFIILIFYFFIFQKKWSEKKVFLLMLGVMFLFEFLWQNFLLLNVVTFVPVSILLISIWGFLTFIPFWLVDKSLQKHKKMAIFYLIWPVIGFFMALVIG